MAQRVDRKGSASGRAASRLNYRGDLSVTLPGGELGEAEGTIFAHLRFGQGSGVGLRPTYTSSPNTTAFEVSGVGNPDSSFAILAQAWYQLAVPLASGASGSQDKPRLEFTVGKIDPFVFFDQNAAAQDETRATSPTTSSFTTRCSTPVAMSASMRTDSRRGCVSRT